jgi:hypothetical protein
MSYIETPRGAVFTARRAPDGWIAYLASAPSVCGYGETELVALEAFDALFVEPYAPPQDVEHAPAPWQV